MKNEKRTWLYDLILLAVLVMAAYFRFIGVNWDENQHLHPDERFLTMVESGLAPAQSLSEYFDTANSPLNPHNRGYGFFVYGDFPIVIVRYIAEWVGQTGYDQVALVGRQVSALADLGVIVLLYFLVARVYNRKTALLAAAFSSLAVMQIQQSHFFTVDNPANLFTFLAIFFAVLIVTWKKRYSILDIRESNDEYRITNNEIRITNYLSLLFLDPLFLLSLGFGAALGMAIASKLNAAPMAILLPAAFVLRYLQARDDGSQIMDDRPETADADFQNRQSSIVNHKLNWSLITAYLIAGGIATVLFFRIFQPYAFSGLGINPAWLANIRELQAQSSGDADVPFALQWARRSHLFSFENLTMWGLGLPLGILAWIGFLWMGWRVLKGEWKHALLWGWTALYFGWQSMAFNPTMRYQLPIYPLLCMMAAWVIFELVNIKSSRNTYYVIRITSCVVGIAVLVSTFAWAYAFTRIYTRPHTRVAATRWIYQNLPGPINIKLETKSGQIQQPLPFPYTSNIQAGTPFIASFTAYEDGMVNEIYLPHVTALSLQPAPSSTDPAAPPVETLLPDSNPASVQTLSLVLDLKPDTSSELALANATLTSRFASSSNSLGTDYILKLSKPVTLVKGQIYFLRFESTGILTLAGTAPINESSWDDGLPLRMDGYDGFGGLYDGTLNFEMYWDDNPDKVKRFTDTMAQGDYVFVTSNRQWASVTRIPERFPLTTEYYRALIGCPPGKDVIWCYNIAKPGQFTGELGFKLVQVYESFPTLEIPDLFKWEFNDQFAEEAFTVYDHPKVLIFQKTKDFDVNAVRLHLSMVDISSVVHLTPKQASNYKTLMLPAEELAQQRAGGTWSDLFSYDWIQNKYPIVGLVLWYGFIFLLGLIAYPLTRLALPALGDKGYPVSRFVGMLLLAYVSWLVSSLGGSYTRSTIGVVFAVLAAAGISLGWMRRDELIAEWKSNRRYFLIVEGLFLAFFIFDLLIRLGNPDLWHPAKGGERPMDFSYFNAILKSTSFPAYDPWFEGGYINYYYYGFVIVGTPVKLLGIVPSISYNLILPTLFAMVALGAFCIASNLIDKDKASSFNLHPSSLLSGLSASFLTVLLGNLGTVRMLFQGFQRMAAPGGMIEDANVVQRWLWAFKGFYLSIIGGSLPFGRGDWYWFPSRVIPAPGDVEPITEFPFFTFLYSDLHAHMIVLPLALLGLLWALSLIKSRARMERGSWLASFLLGGLVFGALYPTNLSDIYTYLLIGLAALTYAIWFHAYIANTRWLPQLPETIKRLLVAGFSVVMLVFLSYALYQPYRTWYAQAYGAVDPWLYSHTPIWSYLTQWGLFLFIIAAWLAWETREWMAATPVSALRKLRPYQILLELMLAVLIALLVYFLFTGVSVGWLALPLAAWAGILLLRSGMQDEKRLVLFWVGTALLITMVVEMVVVRGDIGRMNTVFKFYLQSWILFALSAAAAFGWLLTEVHKWSSRWRNIFQLGVALLAAGAFLFTFSAATDKMSDRMALEAPHTLDSMTYMAYATYWDGQDMDLSEDYRAIRWMQDNVQGSPVIVEANCPEYRWCSRFTIYTGLPGVVGWNWHQRQQRALMTNAVTDRVLDTGNFYLLNEPDSFLPFLKKYDVKYIVVGQLERIMYPDGVNKFEQYDGKYWRSVYRDANTVIYEVLP